MMMMMIRFIHYLAGMNVYLPGMNFIPARYEPISWRFSISPGNDVTKSTS